MARSNAQAARLVPGRLTDLAARCQTCLHVSVRDLHASRSVVQLLVLRNESRSKTGYDTYLAQAIRAQEAEITSLSDPKTMSSSSSSAISESSKAPCATMKGTI